jgi:hypothetical protein
MPFIVTVKQDTYRHFMSKMRSVSMLQHVVLGFRFSVSKLTLLPEFIFPTMTVDRREQVAHYFTS